MSYEHHKARMLRDLRALAKAAVDAIEGDEDALREATADGLVSAMDAGDLADAVSPLLEWLVAGELEDAQAALLCSECGGETVPGHTQTGDPADDRRVCVAERCPGWAAW